MHRLEMEYKQLQPTPLAKVVLLLHMIPSKLTCIVRSRFENCVVMVLSRACGDAAAWWAFVKLLMSFTWSLCDKAARCNTQ